MEKHDIPLNTLKECLMFLEWLHDEEGKKMQTQVALDLYGRIKQYFKEDQNNFSLVNVEKGLSAFLTTVSAFYTRLCKDPAPGKNVNKQPKEIVDALLECLPKFLAAIYFLEYCVNPAFKTLGGGWWEQNWPAWNDSSGGDLAKYLYATTTDRKYSQIPGLIPGGFGKDDQVIYYTLGSGYYQGAQMSGDLQKIVDKQFYNFFRSVFVSSVIGESAKRPENAANSLVLARTFCDIVLGEEDHEKGGSLITALNEGLRQQVRSTDKSICWADLKTHCAKLRGQFNRLFAKKRFDFTGQSTDTGNLKKADFANRTADWLRTYLNTVRGKLNQIKTDNILNGHLGKYFTDNLFPYGFTFDGESRFHMSPEEVQDLMTDWREVIDVLRKGNDGLDKLKQILEGKERKSCPPDPPKMPEPPPPAVPEAPKEVVPEKKVPVVPPKKPEVPPAKNHEGNQNQGKKAEGAQNQGKKSEGAQNQGKKAEGAQNQGKKAEGAQNQGKKSEGAQNQGKKAEGAQNQGKKAEGAQNQGKKSEENSPSPEVKSVKLSPSGDTGAPGPHGPHGPDPPASPRPITSPVGQPSAPPPAQPAGDIGDAGPPGPPGSVTLASSSTHDTSRSQVVQVQQADTVQPISPPPSAPSSAPAAATGPTAKPGPPGQGSQGDDAPGSKPVSPKVTVPVQSTSVSGPSAGSTDDQGAGQHGSGGADQGGGQTASSGATTSAGKGGSGGGQNQTPSNNVNKCSDGYTFIEKALNEHGYCLPVNKVTRRPTFKLNNPDLQNKIDNIVPHNDLLEKSKNHQTTRNRNIPGPQPPVPPPQPTGGRTGHHSPPVDPRGRDAGQRGGVVPTYIFPGGAVVEEKPPEPKPLTQYDINALTGVTGKVAPGLIMQSIHDGQKINEARNAVDRRRARIADEERNFRSRIQQQNNDAHTAERGRIPSHVVDLDFIRVPRRHRDGFNPDVPFLNELDAHYNMPLLIDRGPTDTVIQRENMRPLPEGVKPGDDLENKLALEAESKSAVYGDVHISVQKPSYNESHDDSDQFDLHIDVPKPTVQDPVYDWDFDVDSTHIKNAIPNDPIVPSTTAADLNFEFIEYLPRLPPTDFDRSKIKQPKVEMCMPDWSTQKPTHDSADIPDTELFPAEAPRTVRDMLVWMAGLHNPKHQETLKLCITNAFKRGDDDPSDLRLSVNNSEITPQQVFQILKLAAVFASSVLNSIAPKWRMAVSSVTSTPKDSDQSKDPDCCALLCQLRDYSYACCHQLTFLKLQCSREQSQGGWQHCDYGHGVSSPNSPLQAFLTDASPFKTHPFDSCNICRKSRVNMGFKHSDLPVSQQTGNILNDILSPICGGNDPLLTLSSYLNCLTRRTPRTTGELASFFHNFGNELHKSTSQLSPLGSALSSQHDDCPDWDCLGEEDLQAVRGIRGSAPPNSIHDHNDNQDHPKTLSSLLGCDIDNANCPQHLSPITYRAYALYSTAFAHHYLSWAVYLADRLWESLLKMHYDLEKLQCHDSKSKPLHQCDKALPLLYRHGISPPDGVTQSSLTCSDVVTKLEEVVAGQPIASLMTCMDTFLYNIRMPFLYTVFTLWLIATLYILHSLLYRMDVLRIRSHLLTTRTSHLIDVKALLAGSRRMLSLYKDVDYFDDDFRS
ncbi:Ribosome-binding protein 1 [Babesia ovata]|uniref:Ribosome-binding protein 1 n=1 Tax=Babesia ovata TaxID=189622 RepID=A0A2H6KFZ2_9APIC|nr:Ribosome-binding protein 1 [Babesia ovata]GBE61910.1 Ribosome-binding protein 1 [Babesia ovata]